MSTNLKLNKAQTSKILQSGGFFCSWLGNLGKKALTSIAVPLARDNLPGLVSYLTSTATKLKEKHVKKELSEQVKDLLYLFSMKIWMIILKL